MISSWINKASTAEHSSHLSQRWEKLKRALWWCLPYTTFNTPGVLVSLVACLSYHCQNYFKETFTNLPNQGFALNTMALPSLTVHMRRLQPFQNFRESSAHCWHNPIISVKPRNRERCQCPSTLPNFESRWKNMQRQTWWLSTRHHCCNSIQSSDVMSFSSPRWCKRRNNGMKWKLT